MEDGCYELALEMEGAVTNGVPFLDHSKYFLWVHIEDLRRACEGDVQGEE